MHRTLSVHRDAKGHSSIYRTPTDHCLHHEQEEARLARGSFPNTDAAEGCLHLQGLTLVARVQRRFSSRRAIRSRSGEAIDDVVVRFIAMSLNPDERNVSGVVFN